MKPIVRLALCACVGAGAVAATITGPAAAQEPQSSATRSAATVQCGSLEHWDGAMKMCMAGEASAASGLSVHLNQYLVSSNTSGPRGHTRTTGPGMWMLTYGADISPTNRIRVDVMASPEQATVGDKGTPQLLQTENLDAMHPHDPVMALELRDVVILGGEGDRRLTFLFAPRGQASVGPVPFMHRQSAEGNPDAPLGHGLQDGFHDASTVIGVEYKFGRTTLEATGFSGQEITGPFPMHNADSYGLRVNHDLSATVSVGASFANALLPDDAGGAEHNQFFTVWLTTSGPVGGGVLKSASIWGQQSAGHSATFNSFLEEAVFARGHDHIFGRAEAVQFTPEQLDIVVTGGSEDTRWAEALTVGYERVFIESEGRALNAGASYTRDFVPDAFKLAYGADPRGTKVYLRLKIER